MQQDTISDIDVTTEFYLQRLEACSILICELYKDSY